MKKTTLKTRNIAYYLHEFCYWQSRKTIVCVNWRNDLLSLLRCLMRDTTRCLAVNLNNTITNFHAALSRYTMCFTAAVHIFPTIRFIQYAIFLLIFLSKEILVTFCVIIPFTLSSHLFAHVGKQEKKSVTMNECMEHFHIIWQYWRISNKKIFLSHAYN